MYFITEGYRMDKKEDVMLERLIQMNLIDPETYAWIGTRNLSSNGSYQSQKSKTLKMSKIIRDNQSNNNAYY